MKERLAQALHYEARLVPVRVSRARRAVARMRLVLLNAPPSAAQRNLVFTTLWTRTPRGPHHSTIQTKLNMRCGPVPLQIPCSSQDLRLHDAVANFKQCNRWGSLCGHGPRLAAWFNSQRHVHFGTCIQGDTSCCAHPVFSQSPLRFQVQNLRLRRCKVTNKSCVKGCLSLSKAQVPGRSTPA